VQEPFNLKFLVSSDSVSRREKKIGPNKAVIFILGNSSVQVLVLTGCIKMGVGGIKGSVLITGMGNGHVTACITKWYYMAARVESIL
jgi:hypothetical protein